MKSVGRLQSENHALICMLTKWFDYSKKAPSMKPPDRLRITGMLNVETAEVLRICSEGTKTERPLDTDPPRRHIPIRTLVRVGERE